MFYMTFRWIQSKKWSIHQHRTKNHLWICLKVLFLVTCWETCRQKWVWRRRAWWAAHPPCQWMNLCMSFLTHTAHFAPFILYLYQSLPRWIWLWGKCGPGSSVWTDCPRRPVRLIGTRQGVCLEGPGSKQIFGESWSLSILPVTHTHKDAFPTLRVLFFWPTDWL